LPDTVCWLSITGGEPASRNDLPDIFKAAIKHIPNLSLIGMPTNGLYQPRLLSLAEELMKIENHPMIIVTLSIDGSEETHDRVRGVPGGFKRTWDTYTKLKELTRRDTNFMVGIETTVSSLNVDTVLPFLKSLVADKHMVSVTFAHEAYLYQNVSGDSAKGIVPQNVQRVQEIVDFVGKKFRWWHPQDIIERSYVSNVPQYLKNPAKKVVPCMSLISTISMNAFGIVTPCLMWGKKLGTVRDAEYDIQSIYDSPLSEETRREIRADKCPNCWTPCEAYQSVLWSKIPFMK